MRGTCATTRAHSNNNTNSIEKSINWPWCYGDMVAAAAMVLSVFVPAGSRLDSAVRRAPHIFRFRQLCKWAEAIEPRTRYVHSLRYFIQQKYILNAFVVLVRVGTSIRGNSESLWS